MRRARRPAATLLLVAALLLVPLGAAGCASAAAPLASIEDAAGDVDWADRTPSEGYDFVDVRRMAVSLDGPSVVIRLELAGDLPESVDDSIVSLEVVVLFDTVDDGSPEYGINATAAAGWKVRMTDLEAFADEQLDAAEVLAVDGPVVTVRVDRERLGDASSMRVVAGVSYGSAPDLSDRTTWLTGRDSAPDDVLAGLEVVLP